MSQEIFKEEFLFKNLYGFDKSNRIKEWTIKVINMANFSYIIYTYGLLNGKKTECKITVSQGKNKGKKNETTHYEQAILDARSKWNKKRDIEGYKEYIDNVEKTEFNLAKAQFNLKENPLPMLANDYNKNKEKVKELLKNGKIMIQTKLDGYRCIYNTTTGTITTRQGKEYKIIKESGKLYDELQKLPKGLILDGELYTSKINFEVLGVLRKTNELNKQDRINLGKIEYHIYDIIDLELSFVERNKIIKNILTKEKYEKLIYVNTIDVNSEEELNKYHIKFIEQGYEGTMIRNKDALYKTKHRSNDLLKYKEFMDDEFKIVDYSFEKDTSGKNENLIIWIIEVDNNTELQFVKVRPKGTVEERKELYKKCVANFNQFKNRKLWTKFFSYTADGNLRFPTTMRNTYTEYIRDEIL